jgi:hypothetical protein
MRRLLLPLTLLLVALSPAAAQGAVGIGIADNKPDMFGDARLLGTDLLDRGNIASWAQRFVAAAGRTPKVWGLHNYIDANRMATKTTKLLLRSVGGNVWFTETGGIVRRANGSGVRFPTSAARAAKVTRFIFDRLAPLSPRIQRVYLYHWDTGLRTTLPATWDSGFVGPDGLPRPALAVLKGVLARAAAAQRR